MLLQMEDIVREQKPDLFLICGDIYHTPQPSAAVQTMFTDALVNIHRANPDMTIVITAGNHDSSTKHEIFKTPWRALNVFAIGTLSKEEIENHIIEISGKGFVVAVPYAYERNIPEGFFQELLDCVAERNVDNLPVIMSAHTTVRGCDFMGHDNSSEYSVGGIDSFNVENFGEGYDYLALGHIHHEQFIHTGKHNVRYCGSPLAVSFDESYPHSVTIVDVEKHGESANVSKIEIKDIHPLVSLPTEGSVSWEEAKSLLSAFPNDMDAYIRLNVEVDGFLPVEANSEIADIIKDKQCRFCYINTKRKATKRSEMKGMSVEEFQSEKPIDIAQRYAVDMGVEFNDDIRELFNVVLKEIENESRNV